MRASFFSAAFTVSTILTAVGCAAPIDGDTHTDTAAAEASATAPITLGNFLTHPKIKAVRAEVADVDDAHFATVTRDTSCPDQDAIESRSKQTDAHLKVRKLVTAFGASDGAGSTTFYFDAAGRLRFVFLVSETAPASGALCVSESRVYFDELGRRIWEVVRTGRGTTAHPPNMDRSRFRQPGETDQVELDPDQVNDPAAYFDAKIVCAT